MSQLGESRGESLLDGPIELTTDQIRRAARYVAAKSTDIDDARMLLDALGLGGSW